MAGAGAYRAGAGGDGDGGIWRWRTARCWRSANVAPKTQIAANLIRALLAAEGRDQEAGAMFNAVERSGDEMAAS